MKLHLTRKDLIQRAAKRPLHRLTLPDIRGQMRDFARADFICVTDAGQTRILKDRQGEYAHLPRDNRGLIPSGLLHFAPLDTHLDTLRGTQTSLNQPTPAKAAGSGAALPV